MMGNNIARYKLACYEFDYGNIKRAMKHFMISAKCGHDKSLERVKKGFMSGDVTKDDFERALRCHQASHDETKSEQRDRTKASQRFRAAGTGLYLTRHEYLYAPSTGQ